MPPYAFRSTTLDVEQIYVIESLIEDFPFLEEVDDVSTPPRRLQMNSEVGFDHLPIEFDMIDGSAFVHQSDRLGVSATSSFLEERNKVSHEQPLISKYQQFQASRDAHKARLIRNLIIYALIYSTAWILEYFDLGTTSGHKRIKTKPPKAREVRKY